MCVCMYCRHCLGAEEGRGRAEGAGWAAGLRRPLCRVRCWKTGEALELRERMTDGSFVCWSEHVKKWHSSPLSVTQRPCSGQQVWVAVTHLTLCPTPALHPSKAFKNPRWPILTRHLNFALSCYFMYLRVLFQLLKAQFLLPAFTCNG